MVLLFFENQNYHNSILKLLQDVFKTEKTAI